MNTPANPWSLCDRIRIRFLAALSLALLVSSIYRLPRRPNTKDSQ